MPSKLADLRQLYKNVDLDETNVDPDPIIQFQKWFKEAVCSGADEPAAMTLATVDSTGQPSARIVLLRDTPDCGFTFYTDYESRKGLELNQRSSAALLFYWPQLERQVRIEGTVHKLAARQSDEH